MSVNIDIRGEVMRPTLTTSRMSVYLSDTGIREYIEYVLISKHILFVTIRRIRRVPNSNAPKAVRSRPARAARLRRAGAPDSGPLAASGTIPAAATRNAHDKKVDVLPQKHMVACQMMEYAN